MPLRRSLLAALLLPCAAALAAPPQTALLPAPDAITIDDAWRRPVEPFRIADHTWYVGTEGLSVLLVRTGEGAVLLDAGLPAAAPMVLDHLRALGVEPQDVRYLLHSHAHGDHAGGLAALRRATGATLVSNAESAALFARGGSDDIHFGDALLYPSVPADRLVQDGETVTFGGVAFTAHFTPAHTPGSISWRWTDTRDGKPVHVVYADSFSAPGYRLLDNPRYPRIVEDYRRGFAAVRALPCDLLVTPHPAAAGWDTARGTQVRPLRCAEYADRAAAALEKMLAEQRAAR